MRSKAEVIREQLAGLRVLDIGGSGYGEHNAYERELREAWSLAAGRTTLDRAASADISCDLNAGVLPELAATDYDIATAFDVLEHLENPTRILRWIPTRRLLVSLPNGLSPVTRRMERQGSEHLYSFTPYTAGVLLRHGGWRVNSCHYTLGKWSLLARCLHLAGKVWPAAVATGLMLECERARD